MVVTEESFNQNRRIGYGAKKIFDPPPPRPVFYENRNKTFWTFLCFLILLERAA